MTKDKLQRLLGAVAGLLVGILFLTIGFWKTLLLVLLGSIGWLAMGGYRLLPSGVFRFFMRFGASAKQEDE